MSTPRQLLDTYVALGQQVLAQTSTDDALSAVTAVAVAAVSGTSYASITRGRDAGFQTVGATHPDAATNDRFQYRFDNGPCIDAVEDGNTIFLVPDVAHDPRYPTFGPAAARTGVASMLSVRMVFDDPALRASLNLYSKTLDAFDDVAQGMAALMASHGALAVTNVVAREHAANLERALANSRSIGMAVGILMSSLVITSDEAFTLLRITSQTTNRKVAEIAADVAVAGTLDLPRLP